MKNSRKRVSSSSSLNLSNDSLTDQTSHADQTKLDTRFQSYTLPNRNKNNKPLLQRKGSLTQQSKKSNVNCPSPLPPPPPPPSTMAAALADHFGKDYLLYHPIPTNATLPRSGIGLHASTCDDCSEHYAANPATGAFAACSFGSYAHMPSTALRYLYDSTLPIHHNCHLDRLVSPNVTGVDPNAFYSEFTPLNANTYTSACSTLAASACGCESIGHMDTINLVPASTLNALPTSAFTPMFNQNMLNQSDQTSAPLEQLTIVEQHSAEPLEKVMHSSTLIQCQSSSEDQTQSVTFDNYPLLSSNNERSTTTPTTNNNYEPAMYSNDQLDQSNRSVQSDSYQHTTSHSPSSRHPLTKEASFEANL